MLINQITKSDPEQKILSKDDVQQRLYEMLDKFDVFCIQKGFRYYLTFGTLLGSIRHNGFIPWDDDIDVMMPREDYERFIKYDFIDKDIDIVSYKHSKSYIHPYTYCNLSDKKTIIKEAGVKRSTGKGLFIDVFPLDGVPKNPLIRRLFVLRVCFLRTIINCSNRNKSTNVSLKSIIQNLFISISNHVNIDKLWNHLDSLLKKYPLNNSKYCTVLVDGNPNKFIWESKDLETICFHQFVNREFMIPNGYHNVLSATYGDYMKLPPKSEQVGHHGIDAFLKNG